MRKDTQPTRLPGIRAVFFDAGNTLLREKKARWKIYSDIAREFGGEVKEEEVARAMLEAHEEVPQVVDGFFRYSDRWFDTYLRVTFEKLKMKGNLQGIKDHLFAIFRDPETFSLFPETLPVLDELKAMGKTLGIVSNWSNRLPGILEAFGLNSYFSFVIVSAEEQAEKPEKKIFRLALEKAGLGAEEVLFVGDHPVKDGNGAIAAGMRAALIQRKETGDGPPDPFNSLLKPDTTLDRRIIRIGSLLEVLELVED